MRRLENLIAGTDCGFAQEELNRRVHPSVMWAKLEAMAEGARIASQQLWVNLPPPRSDAGCTEKRK